MLRPNRPVKTEEMVWNIAHENKFIDLKYGN